MRPEGDDRWLLAAVVACLVGCGRLEFDPLPVPCSHADTLLEPGDSYPLGDGCNACTCATDGTFECTTQTCGPQPDAGAIDPEFACGPTGGCPVGPACGPVCCNAGESCEAGKCQCGTGNKCESGFACEQPISGNCGTTCIACARPGGCDGAG
jgi:hypothetical protein